MKEQFRSFKKLNDKDLTELWKNAIFVFDTNVLHSIYRYKTSTSEEVLELMERLTDRIWIPHHVALEFHRNRIAVIRDQHKKFDDTRKVINNAIKALKESLSQLQLSKRHSHIDPSPLLSSIDQNASDFLVDLDNQEQQSLTVDSDDELLARIEDIFEGRVGDTPSPTFIANIVSEGKKRYESKVPPGYLDATKSKDADNTYTFNGIEYERQYGDLIVWKQIIQYAAEQQVSDLIFITEDNKEDWWQKDQGKTTGFRWELVNEIHTNTTVDRFKAYSLLGFLNDAKEYLSDKGQLSQDAIEDVSSFEDNMRRYEEELAAQRLILSQAEAYRHVAQGTPDWQSLAAQYDNLIHLDSNAHKMMSEAIAAQYLHHGTVADFMKNQSHLDAVNNASVADLVKNHQLLEAVSNPTRTIADLISDGVIENPSIHTRKFIEGLHPNVSAPHEEDSGEEE